MADFPHDDAPPRATGQWPDAPDRRCSFECFPASSAAQQTLRQQQFVHAGCSSSCDAVFAFLLLRV
jgi:hypothetical protein